VKDFNSRCPKNSFVTGLARICRITIPKYFRPKLPSSTHFGHVRWGPIRTSLLAKAQGLYKPNLWRLPFAQYTRPIVLETNLLNCKFHSSPKSTQSSCFDTGFYRQLQCYHAHEAIYSIRGKIGRPPSPSPLILGNMQPPGNPRSIPIPSNHFPEPIRQMTGLS